MNSVQWEFPQWLWLLWAVPGLIALGVYGLVQRRRGLRLLADARLLPAIAPRQSWMRDTARTALVGAALTLLVIALLGPRWGETTEKIFRRNIDVMVLLDVSRSMLARDIAPNRLERAKISIVDDLIPALAGDRVGVIAFAGMPRLVCPLTDDYGYLRLALDDVDTRSSPRGGTLIGDAIREAVKSFPRQLDTQRVILLITDGEDQKSFPLEAAKAAWEDGQIPVVAVALGDEQEGARIPIPSESGTRYLEYEGQTVWSRANFDVLRQVAAVSDLNAFVPVGTRNFDLGEIYRTRIVPGLRHRDQVQESVIQAPAQFHWFAGAALVLLFIHSFLREGGRPPTSVAAAALRSTAKEAA